METFVNDTLKITVDADIDVSGYSSLRIKWKDPNGVTGCWTAAVCAGDNNCLTYTCVDGDLYVAGDWLAQGLAEDAGVQLHGIWFKFVVHAPLAPTCTTVPPTTPAP